MMDISQGSVATESHTNTLLSVPTELTSVYLAKRTTGHHSVFYRLDADALPGAKPTVSKHRGQGTASK